MIPGLVTIEFTTDTTKRSKGDRLMVDKKQAEAFTKKNVAKLVDESEPKHSLPAPSAKPDAPASGAN